MRRHPVFGREAERARVRRGRVVFVSLMAFVLLRPAALRSDTPSLEEGKRLLEQGKPREAHEVLTRAVRREPENPEAHHALGRALLATGRLEQASKSAARAIALRDTVAAYHLLLAEAEWSRAVTPRLRDAPDHAAAARRQYERVLALDPRNVQARHGLVRYYLEAPAARGGTLRSGKVALESAGTGPGSLTFGFRGGATLRMSHMTYAWGLLGAFIVIYVVLLVTGAVVGFLRLRDSLAFEFALLWLSLGFFVAAADTPLVGLWPRWVVVSVAVAGVSATAIVGPLVLRVFSAFPTRTRLGALLLRWQWVAWLVFGLLAAADAAELLGDLVPATRPLADATRRLRLGSGWQVGLLMILFGSLVLAQRLGSRGKRERRSRAFELGLAFMVATGILYLTLSSAPVPPALEVARVFGGMVLSPALFAIGAVLCAWAVTAHRLFGLRFVLRRGLQHLLLSRGVLMAEAFVLFMVLVELFRRGGAPVTGSVPAVAGVSIVTAGLVAAGLRRVNRPLMAALDRRFFTEAYDARRVLLEVGQQVTGLRDREAIFRRAGEAVLAALHPGRLAFFLRGADGAPWSLGWQGAARHRSGSLEAVESAAGVLAAPDDSVAELEEGRVWVERPVRHEELEAARAAGGPVPFELFVALRKGEELLGCAALATKLSEEPYSREDRELLLVVATQMGLALENAALLEIARREAQQSRDLEIARRVQQGLFPRELPGAAGWECAAICRPARAVGGDYYDLFETAPGRLAVALGDVSGKGLGASLLTASLHAVVRSHAPRRSDDLGGMMVEINAHLVASTPPEIFATLFVAVLDTESGRLRYVNGGHPPPFVIRAESGEAVALAEGGPVVGILDAASFPAGEVVLGAGDAVVVYSDGVTEATDSRQRMLEEAGLLGALAGACGQDAQGTLARVVEAVDRFVAGAEQADDISVIVIRRAPPGATRPDGGSPEDGGKP